MSLAKYAAQCKEWEKEYGVPSRAFRFDPSELTTSCVKCHKTKKKMNRHHICSDYLFALLRPDLYARRYLEFRKEDVAKLCKNCHMDVERFYDPIQAAMLQEYSIKICTPEWCEKWRSKFREAFERWLKKEKRKKRKKSRSR